MSDDFDFLFGSWHVEHRRLAARLSNSNDWQTFSGTCVAYPLMGGIANVDDNVLHLPSGSYRAISLRVYHEPSKQWSIWWVDGRTGTLDTPVKGSFADGVGNFETLDVIDGRKINVRFMWSAITPASAHWEQAFSADGGATWETNWTMEFTRIAKAAY